MARITLAELANLATRVAIGEVDIDSAMASLDVDDDYGRDNLPALARYEAARRADLRRGRSPAQRRGLALLKTLLTATQLASLRRSRQFIVELPSGNAYRIYPATGSVHLVERHGPRNAWYMRGHFCYHDTDRALPPADVAAAALLLLLSDEERFLAEANFTASQLWDPNYSAAAYRRYQEQYERDARAELANEGVDADLFTEALRSRERFTDADGELLPSIRLRPWWTEEQTHHYVETGERPQEPEEVAS